MAVRPAMTADDDRALTIRPAGPADAAGIAQLAALDSSAPLAGEIVVAEIGGEIWAACSLRDGRMISDPFRPAGEARALLELRAGHLRGATGGRARRLRLRALRRASAPVC